MGRRAVPERKFGDDDAEMDGCDADSCGCGLHSDAISHRSNLARSGNRCECTDADVDFRCLWPSTLEEGQPRHLCKLMLIFWGDPQ